MSVSTLKVYPSKISKEETSPPILKTTQPEKSKTSTLRSLSLITQVKSKRDIPQYLIATLLILLVNSILSTLKSIEDPEKNSKKNPNS